MLQLRNGEFGVFIVKGNRAVFHPMPGAVAGKPVNINLPDDTLVVTTGRHSVEDGQSVKIR